MKFIIQNKTILNFLRTFPITNRFVSKFAFIFLLIIIYSGEVRGEEGSKNETPIIRSINLVRFNVFTDEEKIFGIKFSYLNRLHVITRKNIIEQELLFKVGDSVDLDLFRETERNLRKQNYIGSVKIVSEPNPDGGVDITVYTRDLWTTVVGVEISRINDENIFGLLLQEQSLLGTGSPLSLGWNQNVDGNSWKLSHLFNRIRGTRWEFGTFARKGPAREFQYLFTLDRPLYSLDTKWSYVVQLNNSYLTIKKDTAEEFLEKSKSQRYSFSRVIGRRFIKTISTLSLFVEDSETDISQQKLREIAGFVRFRSFRFAKTTKLNKMERVEDIALGASLGFGAAKAGAIFQGDRDFWRYTADQTLAFPSGSKTWIFQKLLYTTTFENNTNINTIWEFDLKVFSKIFSKHTLALHAFTGSRSNLDERTDFYRLNDIRGLRGFTSSDSLSGEKVFLINIEDRIFSDLKFLTLSLGGVIFIDAGNTWRENENFQISDLNYSAGFGFRWELSKSASARITRVDFAVPLERNRISFKNVVISIASGQTFSL